MNVKSRRIAILSKWDKENNIVCGCLLSNPLCNKCRECEELEVAFNIYDDIKECFKNQIKYYYDGGLICSKE